MKLRYDDDVERFRAQFQEWLDENQPTPEEMESAPVRSSAHRPPWAQRWARRMFDDGWLVPGWPPELGGRNAEAVETLVYLEELYNRGIPRTTNPQGLGIVAPSLIDHGREDQIERYAMPLLRGDLTACLGMSEPDAGSDLAGLKTRAVFDGDSIVLNGQKVWTSGAHDADFCFMFCRTDPDVPKHQGISVVLVPMDADGVTVRPLMEIVHPRFPDLNEVFLDDVTVPAENLVGELNNGWRMANDSLAHERSLVWLMSVFGNEVALKRLLELAPELLG
ncbi:MAG: acyl-CoA dehydrogenase family protein, partial [bacterium]|nr:acyl-CoA dehydrogenase family protein [bacterium]